MRNLAIIAVIFGKIWLEKVDKLRLSLEKPPNTQKG
jgi:hypothetical protein